MSDNLDPVPLPAESVLPSATPNTEGGSPSHAAEGSAPAPTSPPPVPAKTNRGHGPRRELVETLVFVVVVLLLLKAFVAEAYVIPSGSMATTLLGHQRLVPCPRCGFEFPVNCHREAEPGANEPPIAIVGCICPNCCYRVDFRRDGLDLNLKNGDRVLVAKFLYESPWLQPRRHEIVVFKFPREPQVRHQPNYYIKRLIGLPDETVGIWSGDLYVDPGSVAYRGVPGLDRPSSLSEPAAMYEDHPDAVARFRTGKFKIVRKTPDSILALRRPVHDNDHLARDLATAKFPARWAPETEGPVEAARPAYLAGRRRAERDANWVAVGPSGFRHPAREGDLAWLRYRHLVVPRSADSRLQDPAAQPVWPELITDSLGYNSWEPALGVHPLPGPNWVGDLILECEATFEEAATPGEFVLELAKGPDRFRARWSLPTGQCSLVRLREEKETVLARAATDLRPGNTYQLRFANVDERLVVWVNGRPAFGDGIAYLPSDTRGPARNDLRPTAIAARGVGVAVRFLSLWRDSYYTVHERTGDAGLAGADLADPARWGPLNDLPMKTLYVQPGHYLCLGDNSPESSDGRMWGLVPERLLVGRALLTIYPPGRAGRIR